MAKKNQPAEAPAEGASPGVASSAEPRTQPAEAPAGSSGSLIRLRESICVSTRAGAMVSFLPGATVDASMLDPRDVDWLLEHPEYVEGI